MPLIDSMGRPIASPEAVTDNAASGENPYVKNTDLANFTADVLQASLEVPVIVDFWAPWCEPCKQLGPMLEKAVAAAKGAVHLVKLNIDENQELAQQFRIQSIPAVYAFKNGQPVDGFMGAVPETQIDAFVQNLIGAPDTVATAGAPNALSDAEHAFAIGDMGAAAQIYGQILQNEPGQPAAVAGLARCYLKSGDIERARSTLGLVRPDGASDEAIRAVEAELALKEKAPGTRDIEPLRARVAADPGDLQARYDLALGLDAGGDRDRTIDELLEIVKRNRNWNDGAARKQLVTLFDAMGPQDPRTISARRRLSSLLFS